MKTNSLIDDLLSYCIYCNLKNCNCLYYTDTKKKTYSDLVQKQVKRKKWVTSVALKVLQSKFTDLKKKLGTGGVYSKDTLIFRGKIKERLRALLKDEGFEEIEK